jgi:HSP20 family protein
MSGKKTKGGGDGKGGGINGILKGVSDLVEKLGELADKGDQLSRTGEINWKAGEKDLKGIYGFSVKVGMGGDREVKVEPFGNIRRDKETGESEVQEIREPIVDVFEEEDHILVVAELPGIAVGDVRLEVKDDLLTLRAEKGEKKYRKEILLPGSFPKEKMAVTSNNGIVEIRCIA